MPTDMDKFINLAMRNYKHLNFHSFFHHFTLPEHSEMDFYEFLETIAADWPLRVLITGDSGIGKTTFLNIMANKWAKGEILFNCEIVLLIDLSELVVFWHEVDTWKILSLANPSVDQDMSIFTDNRGGKGLCFLLDGLDEYIKIYAMKGSFIHKLLDRKFLTQSTIIITSKPNVLPLVENKADIHVELLGFDDKNILHYIQEKFLSGSSDIEKFSEYLDKHQHIKKLCHVPLNLAILVFIYENRQTMFSSYGLPIDHQIDLPQTETEMYEKLVLLSLIGDWCKHSEILCGVDKALPRTINSFIDMNPLDMSDVFYHIANLSYTAFLFHKTVFMEEEIEPFLYNVNSSLLISTRWSMFTSKNYRLRHPQIQQFLASFYFHSWVPIQSQTDVMNAIRNFNGPNCTEMLKSDFWKHTCGLLKKREDFLGYFKFVSSLEHNCNSPNANLQHMYFKMVYHCSSV